jgi:hypothetical protein
MGELILHEVLLLHDWTAEALIIKYDGKRTVEQLVASVLT